MNSSILRRLALLQQIADANRPAQVVILFTDGTATIADPGAVLGFFQELGPHGRIDRFQSDSVVYGPWAALLTVVLRPAKNRRLEDFE